MNSNKDSLRKSLGVNKTLEWRLDAADAANGRIPIKPQKAAERATFSMPPEEAQLVPKLQEIAGREGRIVNSSEIVRAAILHLSTLNSEDFIGALDKVRHIKPGRKRDIS